MKLTQEEYQALNADFDGNTNLVLMSKTLWDAINETLTEKQKKHLKKLGENVTPLSLSGEGDGN